MTSEDSGARRGIVSFVRRSPRLNTSQKKAWDRHAAQFVVDVPAGETSTAVASDASVDWEAAFGRKAPLVVEIGSGNGDSLVPMAANRPEANFVAFEVYPPGVASTLGSIGRAGIDNVRVVMADGARGLGVLFPTGSLSEVWTFFADPWHKKRHHKRRIVNPGFADVVADRLIAGGRWRLATDWEEYALWQREVLDAHPGFVNEYSGWAPRFADRPVTRYEARGLAAGRQVWDLTYRSVK